MRPDFEDPAREHYDFIVVDLPVEEPLNSRFRCKWCDRFELVGDSAFDRSQGRRHLAKCKDLKDLDPPTSNFFLQEIQALQFASKLALPVRSEAGGKNSRSSFYFERLVYNDLHQPSTKNSTSYSTLDTIGMPRRSGIVEISPGKTSSLRVETSDIHFKREEARKLEEEVRREAERRRAQSKAAAEARHNKWREAIRKASKLKL